MIRPGPEGATDPLLGRPLALYDVVRDPAGAPTAFDVVYLVVGRGTAALAQRRPGERVAVWGPLGNGFGPPPAGRSSSWPAASVRHLSWLWAAGGSARPVTADGPTCQTAKTIRARQPAHVVALAPGSFAASAITLLYGVRTAALLAGVDDFRRAGIEVELATDDGTAGHHGFVTELLARRLERGDRPAKIVGCGPPAMLAALAKIALQYDIPCEVSLENHMACGFGACFSCVAPIRQADGSTDLRRVCVEGPIVAADLVDWPRLVH